MNIFVLDYDPVKAAQYECDKHVVKMILESAQLLCSAHHMCGSKVPDRFYKLTHKNHPCAIWARSHQYNYNWLCGHAVGLLKEYTFRYGKIHASTDIIEWCRNHEPNIVEPKKLSFAQAMPEQFKHKDTVTAYRAYYNIEKRNTIKMCCTKRETPDWWTV